MSQQVFCCSGDGHRSVISLGSMAIHDIVVISRYLVSRYKQQLLRHHLTLKLRSKSHTESYHGSIFHSVSFLAAVPYWPS